MELVDGLPPSVVSIIEFLARYAKGYNNHLKWNEFAKFKGDLMNEPTRWGHVDVSAFRAKCLAEGMRAVDTDELVDYLKKRQAGRRLVPQSSYRTFKFGPPPEKPEPYISNNW